MTKQEAIKILKGICHNCTLFPHCVYEKPDCYRAINMAIDLLGKESSIKEKYDRLKENAEILSKACAEKEYVVRCKDCENWQRDWESSYLPNHHYCAMVDTTTEHDFYCSYGERGEADDE